ncbi:FAD-dependent oxidoreductase (plasmid) [Agrobacterium leguminum]|uniref:Glycine/D-amino acid oxidase, deaminating n=1 Tax=Agrobacterium deltaense NCPPB 1641 TaxID=1183425 RepID=A0A1S7U9N0_9HYPH|nr:MULTISPECIES: FAD-dependent oxidoreductase [Agrobacterium]WFS70105.1 FAD-dependent oxidoreductase [Agrobacterium leguminum]CVI63519.1 Glycine/D-amino acid oxidase, deaminating [Agrobacterium deltaense NCPPB 1641]
MKRDVAIIGGGLTGCALAYFLAREGARVTVFEQYDINTQASGANAGSLHAQIIDASLFEDDGVDISTAVPSTRILIEAAKFWAALDAEFHERLEIHIKGGLVVADTDRQVELLKRKIDYERSQGLVVDFVDRDRLRVLAPYLTDQAKGGALCPLEGSANSLLSASLFSEKAKALGAEIHLFEPVQAIDRDPAGYRIVTDKRTVVSDIVVNCTGAGANRINGMLGFELPIWGIPYQATVTEPTEHFLDHILFYGGGGLTLKQTVRGAVIIGGGWEAEPLGAQNWSRTRIESLCGNMETCLRIVPRVGELRAVRSWTGYVNITADMQPIIGEVPGEPGFYVANFPYMGFTGGPFTGWAASQQVLGKPMNLDLGALSPARFANQGVGR